MKFVYLKNAKQFKKENLNKRGVNEKYFFLSIYIYMYVRLIQEIFYGIIYKGFLWNEKFTISVNLRFHVHCIGFLLHACMIVKSFYIQKNCDTKRSWLGSLICLTCADGIYSEYNMHTYAQPWFNMYYTNCFLRILQVSWPG